MNLEIWEMLSYVVTVIGLPLAIAVFLFGRAYLLLYEEKMTLKQKRRRNSWKDYIQDWCAKEDFCAFLPRLLKGDDPGFVRYITVQAANVRKTALTS